MYCDVVNVEPLFHFSDEIIILNLKLIAGKNKLKRQFLCDMHSLVSVGLLMYLFMNDFLPGCLFAVVVI